MDVRPGFRGQLSADERTLLDRLAIDMGPRLLAYVRRVYGSEPDAEDIVAEAFCRAASNIAALRASARQDLYLLTVARNLCRDRFRGRRHQAVQVGHLEPRGTRTDPREALSHDERIRALREAVAALPEELREIVVLRLSTGLKFEEIAEMLHIPLGTALSRMHAALRRLREMLGGFNEH